MNLSSIVHGGSPETRTRNLLLSLPLYVTIANLTGANTELQSALPLRIVSH